jgi:hypothetical protein
MPFYFPRSQKKLVVMILATVAIVSLISVNWAMGRVSAWVVYHDPVYEQMEKEGHWLEHLLAEVFIGANEQVFIAIELICGVTFLGLLWHTLYRDKKK